MTYSPLPTPAQNPAKRTRWAWFIGAGVALVVALGCAGNSASDSAAGEEPAAAATATSKTTKGAAKPDSGTAGLNQPARDGDFQFTVTGLKCGVNHVGSDLIGQDAQGQYCLVSIQIKNIDKKAHTFSDSEQKAYDAKKVEYSVDSTAALYANSNSQVLFEQINPGNTVKGKLVFDVPDGTKLTSLELHDSLFSGGVKVNLK
jgi:uncharacterized protein DUF4352